MPDGAVFVCQNREGFLMLSTGYRRSEREGWMELCPMSEKVTLLYSKESQSLASTALALLMGREYLLTF